MEDIGIEGRANHITYLGHSTTVIEMDGVRVLTDPLLRRRTAHLLRGGPVPAPGKVDAILISHGHYDHLDFPSLVRLPRHIPVVLPRGLGKVVQRRGFGNVIELEEGEELPIGDIVVRATHADHPGRSAPGRTALTVGFALLGSRRVFFAGDTDLFPEMDGLVDDLDVALLPIWGWGPTMGVGHLDPERAAQALTLLRPRTAVPIHWGTLRPFYTSAKAPFLRDPPEAFASAAARLAPGVAIRVLAPGEHLEIP
jgi:L-ascorbate metabolism protein UlaG (beta-lactamase superfamily)